MYNKAILIGRITADPELKQTPTGLSVISFSIAVDRRYSGQGSERKADFINVVAWRQSAEFVSKYFHKGDAIGVDGSIQTRNYEDKSGNKRVSVEVVADNVFFVGSKNSSGNTGNTRANMPTESDAPPVSFANGGLSDFVEIEADDDLPF